MARPYLNIASSTYSNGVVTLEIEALRMRGVTSISLTGLSQSRTIILATDSSGNSYGYYNTVDAVGTTQSNGYTFSANLGLTSSATSSTGYTASTISVAFSGSTANSGQNIKITLPGSSGVSVFSAGNVGYTFSSTQSISNALNNLVASMSFSGTTYQFSATVSGTAVIFSAPYGNYYNNYTASVIVSGSGITASNLYTFSGGQTTYRFALNDLNSIFGTLSNSQGYLTI